MNRLFDEGGFARPKGNRILNRTSAHEQESGVVVINKGLFPSFAGLLAACHLNVKEVRDQHTYRYFHGDKESFWLGFEMMGSEYSFSPYMPGLLGTPGNSKAIWMDQMKEGKGARSSRVAFTSRSGLLCSTQLLHPNPIDGKPLWFNNGIMASKFEPNSPPAVLTHWLLEEYDFKEVETAIALKAEIRKIKSELLVKNNSLHGMNDGSVKSLRNLKDPGHHLILTDPAVIDEKALLSAAVAKAEDQYRKSEWFLFEGNLACIYKPNDNAKEMTRSELSIIQDISLLYLRSK